MGRIVISSNITLDAVVQDPDGQEGFERGGWFHQAASPRDFEDWVAHETHEVLDAQALLLGRRSFDWFASRAPAMADRVSRQWADAMERLPKYVASSTRELLPWSNSSLLDTDLAAGISRLKERVDGDILVYGSYQLVRTLIARDLADELRLVIFPIALGAGRRLFDEVEDRKPLRLLNTREIGDGLVSCAYEFVRG